LVALHGKKERTRPPGYFLTGSKLSEFRSISITSIQKAKIWERVEIIRGRVGENNPFN